jgi:hypothetical protein
MRHRESLFNKSYIILVKIIKNIKIWSLIIIFQDSISLDIAGYDCMIYKHNIWHLKT